MHRHQLAFTRLLSIFALTVGVLSFSSNSFASEPIDINSTNVRGDQFSVSWLTEVEEVGYLNYGSTPALGNTQDDDQGAGITTDTHHVTVRFLEPNTLYYYDIVSGDVTYDNDGLHFTITTGPVLDPPVGADFAYGQVLYADNSPAEGAIVYLNLSDADSLGTSGVSQDASATVDLGGWWNYNLVNLRTPDLTAYFEYSLSGDDEILAAKKGTNGFVTQTIDTSNDSPVPTMTLGWMLNMTDMEWRQKETYSSAASCEMILDYIREGMAPDLTQTDIYNYAHPEPDSQEMTPDEADLALGHFDPYDAIVSNWADSYDSLPGGNPYQGYNFTVHTQDPIEPDAINSYMRDIVYWMAYTVTQEDWWLDGALVARPNTPAALPVFGDTLGYNHWVVIKGAATDINPLPEPHVDPWNTPDFTVYGFWMKDPDISGIGQDTYKTAAECEATYFKPLNTGDSYDGLYLQVAEPPEVLSNAHVKIKKPTENLANLEFIGTKPQLDSAQAADPLVNEEAAFRQEELSSPIRKRSWKDLVDPHILSDPEAVDAFEGTQMDNPILVHRLDLENSDYYLVPFNKDVGNEKLTSAVIILDTSQGYFKEATWTDEPQKYLNVDEEKAKLLVYEEIMPRMREYYKDLECELVWEAGELSTSPFKPFWKLTSRGNTWYVTQEEEVISTGRRIFPIEMLY